MDERSKVTQESVWASGLFNLVINDFESGKSNEVIKLKW